MFVDPFNCLVSLLLALSFFSLSWRRMTVYSSRAPNTKMMQAMTQHSIAVKPSALGNIFTEICSVFMGWAGAHLGTVCLYGVVDVDEHEENCHQQSHPSRNYLRVYQETRRGQCHLM